MTWSDDERFTAWLDSQNIANDANPLDDDTLDLMYDAWRAGCRRKIGDSIKEAEDEDLYEISEHAASGIDLGCYTVKITQGQGGMVIGEFHSLDDALECAAGEWGEGAIGIEKPDGSWHEFGEEWRMRPKLILMRLRKGKLNPRQEHILKKWKKDRFLWMLLVSLDFNPRTPGAFFDQLAELMEDLGGDAKGLFMESLDWGLFELFEWQNGWPRPDSKGLDAGIFSGRVRSL